MELRDYLPIVRRNLLAIVALVLVGTLGGLIFAATRPVLYSADAKVFVSARSATTVAEISEAAAYITEAVASYADVATSAVVLDPVIERLGLDEDRASLRDRITVTAGTQETVLDIRATADTPQRAAQLANAIGRQLPTAVQTLTSGSSGTRAPLELRLVDPAVAPVSPDGPGLIVYVAVGLLIGLIAGFIAAVLRESLDSRLRTEQQVAEVAGAPVLGSIPQVGGRRSKRKRGPRDLRMVQAESIRSVRNALQFLHVDGTVRSLVVTSAMPGDGKSSLAINLAISLADNGDRVLVVDGDLRKPDVASYLGLDGTIGLADVLIGKVTLDDALQPVAGSSLTALPSGSVPPNPNELIQWASMQTLMTELLARFDRVVIDSPPLLPVSDAGVLARLTDGALVVVTAGRTSAAQLSTVVERLRRVDATVLGAVVNGARLPAGETSYGTPSTSTSSALAVSADPSLAVGGPAADATGSGPAHGLIGAPDRAAEVDDAPSDEPRDPGHILDGDEQAGEADATSSPSSSAQR